ncbi:undecaprenyl-diphosphatase [Paenibacillus baekrokdamisoli]|uniref:Undecaprenyl-diphosphatase n=1 Tax=Paenibacillus baekrokdamisoli TaxID=1712516 RepID=A0A3G9J0P9_9BACL|nr:undecaprenyl-diphosphatase [Paenibacillus baekrokdamisoli]MBB3071895.1 undecaprenyl-diphosphatase [Paenibacillus baekrokdamisoli]BBH24122.1 undecaprenyl-diphosphatase [Paenibacillus baekrokdamisoli]
MLVSQLDYKVFEAINGLAGRLPWVDAIMEFIAKDTEYLFYIAIVIYWFTRREDHRRMVVQALISACAAFGTSMILSHLFYRDRPFVAHRVIQLISHPINASFPSDHAIGAFVIATSIWLFRKRDGYIWLAIAACIAFSRIWTGVHYPLDVISGAVIGSAAAVLIHRLFTRSSKVRQWFQWSIGLYEGIERRIWPTKVMK